MWGQHYYLYVLVVVLPKDGKLKCHYQLIYNKLLNFSLFLFSTLKVFRIFTLSFYKTVKSPKIKSTRVEQQRKSLYLLLAEESVYKLDYPVFWELAEVLYVTGI